MFIGSSTESRSIANALQENLMDDLDGFVWSQSGFDLSSDTLTSLEGHLDTVDFAAFIFAPDDDLGIRGGKMTTVRDNVLFECGLFMGRLGRERTFIVRPRNAGDSQRVTGDLLGLTTALYDGSHVIASADDLRRALLPAANQIRSAARRLKAREQTSATKIRRRVNSVLARGGTESIAAIADGAIYVADKRHEYPQDLRRFLKNGDIVPSKYLYWTPQGSSHWLELCRHETYRYHRNSLKLLRKHARGLVAAVTASTGTAEIDLVSVGSGDGVKDNLLLMQLSKELKPQEFIYYYPVDISDTLIVEAVRGAMSRGLASARSQFRVKALIADFVKLDQLQAFYEERPAKNVFCVLGNTVGNADEDELMGSVANAMLDGDLVLMEINIGNASDVDPVWSDPVALEHDFTPLAILNVPFEPEKIGYDTILGQSIVEGTQSVLATYTEADIEGESVRDVKLSIVHYYSFDDFKKRMQERMNVRIVWFEASEDVGLVLAQRDHALSS